MYFEALTRPDNAHLFEVPLLEAQHLEEHNVHLPNYGAMEAVRLTEKMQYWLLWTTMESVLVVYVAYYLMWFNVVAGFILILLSAVKRFEDCNCLYLLGYTITLPIQLLSTRPVFHLEEALTR